MGSNGNTWFDYEGRAKFWNSIPLRTVKKAVFKNGNITKTLTKLILNNVTHDFNKTAQGGAVIVPPDYSVMQFIAPDDRIDYETLLNGNFGDALTAIITTLSTDPIPAWDKFAAWIGGIDVIQSAVDQMGSCEIQTIDGTSSQVIDMPYFTNIKDMASLLDMTKAVTHQAHNQPLSMYQLDTASFGWAFRIATLPDENGNVTALTLGFLFRE